MSGVENTSGRSASGTLLFQARLVVTPQLPSSFLIEPRITRPDASTDWLSLFRILS
jgi:hypothetical protein